MNNTKTYLGTAIKAQRTELSLDQNIVAEYADISKWTLSKIETGKANPNLDTLVKLLDTLGLDLVLQKREDSTIVRRDTHAHR